MRTKRTNGTRRQTSRRLRKLKALPLRLECLERRDLLSFGSLVQAGLSQTPFTNTSDISGQSGTVILNSEVEPYVAVDPTNPKHIVGAWQQDRWSNGGARGIVAGVSTDGGNTWTDMPIPGATVNSGGTDVRASDPWVSIGPDGTVYVAYLSLPDPNIGNPTALRINASTDGGYTWGAPTAAITNSGDTNVFDDKDSLTADPYTAKEAYVVWDRLNFSQNIGPAMFSRTTDGGQTWSTPVQIVNPTNGQTIANQLVVLPGDVLVDMAISIDYATNISTIVVMRSTDHGATWSSPVTVNTDGSVGTTDPNNGVGVRDGGIIPMIATDPTSGNIYIVWQDGRFSGNTHDDIAFSMSSDGGSTWSTPIKANQTPTNIPTAEQQAFVPTVAVEANGLVAVSYYDFRNNTGSGPTLTDRWVSFANPSQPNFTFGNEQRLTPTSFNMQLAPNAGGEFLGDYEALVAGGNTTNTFSSFFGATISTSTPSAIFYRGIVPPGTLSLTNFAPPTAVEGASAGGTLATFSDSSPHPNIGTYTAVVTWGDGSVDTLTSANGGIVSNGGGSYSAVDSHTYAEESSGEAFSVQITDNGGGSAGSSATVTVADAALTASATVFSTTQNSTVSGVTVATFKDADPAGAASDYSATVNWGDSDTTASVSIVADSQVAGQFDVVASKSHPYAAAGNYSVTVNIFDAGGATATANSTAIVAEISGTWTPLTNSLIDPYGGETMLLLNNGTIMIQGGGGGMSSAWYQLTPDASGSYLNGTWSTLASMSTQRLYYGSVVLPNGNVVLIGGEYTGPSANRTLTNTGEMYNPTTNTWTAIAPDPYNSQLGDVSAMLLPDGNILVGDKLSTQTDIYHPGTNTWSQGGTRLYNDIHDEESWVKLPDNKIISYDVWSSISNGVGQAQIYDPTTNQWTDAGTVPVILSTAAQGHEMGPCLRLPDGRVLFIGSTGATALYTESTNSWTAGPTMPGGYVADDAPGALMPNGHVIFVADQGGYNNPSALFDYDPTANTITQLSTPDGNLAYLPAFVDRMLMLPTGQMLFCDSSDQLLVYTPPGSPQSSWQPVVNSITQNNGVYTLTGTGLNGVSAGAAYGDDAQMDENFPIVRLTSSTGQVYYATATNWSYSGVGAGTTETVNFALPAGMPAGTYTLQDIGAGIASSGTLFNALTLTSFTPPTNVLEGASAGGTLATFSDANASPNINSYTATVTWGDGATDTLTAANGGIVSNGGNSFKVVDSHTYAEESASESFSVQITDQSGSNLVSSATVTVADAALTAGALTPPAAVEGQPFSNVTVFHFSDADPAGTASDYTAVVTLGDGNTVTLTSSPSASGQIVAHTGGGFAGFDVQLSYAYAEELSGKTFSVVVTDAGGATASGTRSTFSVADAALTAGPLTPPSAVEGQPFSNVTVFHFTDGDPAGTASDYSALVTLGDGNTVTLSSTSSANGQIVAHSGGGFDVQLSYSYGEELSGKTFSVAVTDAGGASASGTTSTFSVADAALTAGALTPPTAIEGQAFSNVTVFHFTDADPAGTAGDYSALVTLGDGNTVTLTSTASANGQIVVHTGGGFDVQLSHTYAEELSGQTFSVLVSDAGGATASATTSAFSVADAALSAGALTPPTAVEGQSFANVTVFHFSDSDPAGAVSDYSALVTLGDGNSVTLTSTASASGQIVANAGGGFDVQLSYTYGEELSGKTFSVVVSDSGGATTSGTTSSFSVADAALTAGALTPPTAVEGQAFSNVTVFHFSDADPAGTASDYSALVTLGDGNTVTLTSTASGNGQIVAHTGGGFAGFDVQLSHTYAEELSGKTFSVLVTDAGGATASGSTSTFNVADAALTASGVTFNATANNPRHGSHGRDVHRCRSGRHRK